MRNVAIIVAAGKGERFKNEEYKPFVMLKDKPIIAHTLGKFEAADSVDAIILLVTEDRVDCAGQIVQTGNFNKVIKIIAGGAKRYDTVRKGLDNLPSDTMLVAIHDGVRPLIKSSLINRALLECNKSEAVVVGVRPKDTIKLVSEHEFVLLTPPRSRLYAVQTPQVFARKVIVSAYQNISKLERFTDDAGIVEELGYKIKILEGDYSNIKITTPEDLEIAEMLLNRE